MSQDFTNNTFQRDHVVDTDMENIEENFGTLRSIFSGTDFPDSPVDGQLHHNTTYKIPFVYVQDYSKWKGVFIGDDSTQIWIYRNSAPDGFVAIGGVSDQVLAVKGGSTYTTGGATAGSWTISSHTHTVNNTNVPHNHKWINLEPYGTGQYKAQSWTNTGVITDIPYVTDSDLCVGIKREDGNNYSWVDDCWTNNSNATHNHTTGSSGGITTFRPAATVGIICRMRYN